MPFVPDNQSGGHFVPDAPEVPGGGYEAPTQYDVGPGYESVRDSYTGQSSVQPVHQPGYDPRDLTLFGNQLPQSFTGTKENPGIGSRIEDVGIGAYDSLARVLGVPVTGGANAVNNLVKIINGSGFLPNGGLTTEEGQQMLRQAFAKVGIQADKQKAFNEWWADLGDKAGSQALTAMALIAGSPALGRLGEAVGTENAVGASMSNVAKTMTMHPGQTLTSAVGSGVGAATAPLADDMLKSMGVNSNPQVLELLGSLGGGVAGSTVGSMRRIVPTGETSLLTGQPKYKGLPRSAGGQVREALPGQPAMLPPSFSSEDISKAVAGYKDQVTNWLQNRMGRITGNPNLDPAVTAQRVRQTVEEGYGKARDIEGKMWNEVDMKRPVNTTSAKVIAKEVAASAKDPTVRTDTIPGDVIRDISKLPPNAPMWRVRQLVGVIRNRAATLGMQGNNQLPNDTLRANLTKLASGLDEAIGTQYPGDVNLAKARQFSTWLHDTFSRGPVGAFGDVRNMDMAKQAAQTALPGAMRDPRFASGLAEMGNTVNAADDVAARGEDYLRSTIGEAYRDTIKYGIDPLKEEMVAAKQAEKYMASSDFKRFAKAFPQMDAVLQRQASQLQNAMGNATSIERSAFFSRAGQNPEKAVESLFNSGNSIKDAKLVMDKLGGDQHAVSALQYGLLRKLGNDVNWDPTAMLQRMNGKDTSQLFNTVMGDQGFARLRRMLTAGAQYQTGMTPDSMIGMSPIVTTGRVIGSLLTRASGGHTIQVTSIGTKIGGNIAQRLFNIVPPEYMLQRAMVDPQWERFLLSKVPDNMENLKRTNQMLGLLVGGVEEGNRKLMEKDK